MRVRSVQDVHDLHVWSIAGGMPLLTAHVLVGEDCALSDCEEIRVALNQLLQRDYGIAHTTIGFECADCDPNHLYCDLPAGGRTLHAHAAATAALRGPR